MGLLSLRERRGEFVTAHSHLGGRRGGDGARLFSWTHRDRTGRNRHGPTRCRGERFHGEGGRTPGALGISGVPASRISTWRPRSRLSPSQAS